MENVKELVIISGKGGTGKTSLVGCFAALAEAKVMADCDVDAADLYLILSPEIIHTEDFTGGNVAIIRQDDCNSCGYCFTCCRYNAVVKKENADSKVTYSIDPIACEGCGVCVDHCPVEAIDFPQEISGQWFISETRHGPMVHAKLGIAQENSGKLVTVVRKAARKIAEEKDLPLVIIDGPPGIGCPVLASITGTNLVIVVSEPTLSGIHDLKRVVDLGEHFKIPVAVIINKADINRSNASEIESYCGANNVEILGEVPYDPDITRAQIKGKSLIEYGESSVTRIKILGIWERVVEVLKEDGKYTDIEDEW